MSFITVKAGSSFPEDIGGRSIFIDSVQYDNSLFLKVVPAGGVSETHKIVSGSKFKSPDELIESVVFINDSLIDLDVEYHYSAFLLYDEAKIIGDVNSLTRPANLSKDNNQFFGGLVQTATAADFNHIMLWNPPASGVSAWINTLRVNGRGSSVNIVKYNNNTGFYDLSAVGKGGANKNYQGGYPAAGLWAYKTTSKIGSYTATLPTDLYGVPTALDLGNKPIEVAEGAGLILQADTAEVVMSSFFEWFEEAA